MTIQFFFCLVESFYYMTSKDTSSIVYMLTIKSRYPQGILSPQESICLFPFKCSFATKMHYY